MRSGSSRHARSCKMAQRLRKIMNYRDQENFLRGSRIWGAAVCLGFLAVAIAIRLAAGGRWHPGQTIVFILVAIAVAVLMYYTPDYLHLSVTPEKKRRWEINVRWRIIAAILLLGLLLASSNAGRAFHPDRRCPARGRKLARAQEDSSAETRGVLLDHRSRSPFPLAHPGGRGTAAIILLLLAAAAHLAIVRREDRHLLWAGITSCPD